MVLPGHARVEHINSGPQITAQTRVQAHSAEVEKDEARHAVKDKRLGKEAVRRRVLASSQIS